MVGGLTGGVAEMVVVIVAVTGASSPPPMVWSGWLLVLAGGPTDNRLVSQVESLRHSCTGNVI